MNLRNLLITILAITQSAFSATPVVYRPNPVELWRLVFSAVGPGNGAFLSPAGDVLAVSAKNGMVRAYNISGTTPPPVLWTFTPTPLSGGASIRSKSGVNFFSKHSIQFLAFSVVDDLLNGNTTSRIFVLAMDGTKIFESLSLAGEVTGTPQVTSDGRYIATTHNFNQTGYFSLIDANRYKNDSMPVAPIFQYKSKFIADNKTTPFSDLGFFARPDEGYYADSTNNGFQNTNDLFVWMSDTNTAVSSRDSPSAGNGQIYAFQFPLNYDNSGVGLKVLLIGQERQFQSSTRPIIMNKGRTIYWSMVRGEVRGWVSQWFDRAHNAIVQTGRGNPKYVGALAPPSVTTGDFPVVFGPGATNLVWRSAYDLSTLDTIATDQVLSNRVVVTADNQYVIFGTPGGILTMTSASNLTGKVWDEGSSRDSIQLDAIKGEMALDSLRGILYVPTSLGDTTGSVVGISITMAPTSMPVTMPSSSSMPPSQLTGVPSHLPTYAPFKYSSGKPTKRPVKPTSAPTNGPTKTANLTPTSFHPVPTSSPKAPTVGDNKKTSSAFCSFHQLGLVVVIVAFYGVCGILI